MNGKFDFGLLELQLAARMGCQEKPVEYVLTDVELAEIKALDTATLTERRKATKALAFFDLYGSASRTPEGQKRIAFHRAVSAELQRRHGEVL